MRLRFTFRGFDLDIGDGLLHRRRSFIDRPFLRVFGT